MKILVASLLRALSMMGNVMVLAFFTFLLFGLMGMQLFAGKLRDESGSNPNYGITGFDNIFMSWLTILQCVSLEGWVDGTYTLTHSNSTLYPLCSHCPSHSNMIKISHSLSAHTQWRTRCRIPPTNSPSSSLVRSHYDYFHPLSSSLPLVRAPLCNVKRQCVRNAVSLVFFGAFVVINLVVGVIVSAYDQEKERKEATEQSDCRLSPTERGRERASSLFSLEMACFRIAESNRFENVVMALIVLNTVVLACECTSSFPLFRVYDDGVG